MFNHFVRKYTGVHPLVNQQLVRAVAHQAWFSFYAPNLHTTLETLFHPAVKQLMEAHREANSLDVAGAATGVPAAAAAAPTGCRPGAYANALPCTTTNRTNQTWTCNTLPSAGCNQGPLGCT
jgi:hypothetical protein